MKKIVLLTFVLCLLLTALSLCVLGLLELQIAYASPHTDINVDTAYNMITNGSYPDLVVLDVRRQDEYDSGHIYGAVWIPHTELETRIGELVGHENHEIIVYCLSGYRSNISSGILDSHNFTKVYDMQGGISAWESAGYPVWNATVHNVNTTFNYDTIQAAIDAPQTLDGHTILVDAGTYYEHVTINKPISLIGENRSTIVIDGNGTGKVIFIDITAPRVNVTGFTIRNGTNGIFIQKSDYNIISGNIVTDNQNGIHLFATCTCNPTRENTIRNNIVKNNGIGIRLEISRDNVIYHNNFINNTYQVHVETIDGYLSNTWDDGYPSGGNYWSNYMGVDDYSGPYQNETGSDGIGDTPYEININNQDNYPLMGMFSDFSVTHQEETYHVTTICNSTISEFQFNDVAKTISFNVTGEGGTLGFCRVAIPNIIVQDLWQGNYTVLVDGEPPLTIRNWTDGTYTYIYFTYLHSEHKVVIIPEFPTWTSTLLVLLLALTVAIAIQKRRLNKKYR